MNPFARRKNWLGKDMPNHAVGQDIQNLRDNLKLVNDGSITLDNLSVTNLTVTSTSNIPGLATIVQVGLLTLLQSTMLP